MNAIVSTLAAMISAPFKESCKTKREVDIGFASLLF